MREMKDICKGQIKPRMNPALFERKQTVCKAAKETKQQSQAAKETVCLPSLTDAAS